ncbi:hypothetical protein BC940DRAFT_254439 [Gongronella butleri]|nr:hypothetical protein BC940DRAFT_254439 [Gongronella butleri]
MSLLCIRLLLKRVFTLLLFILVLLAVIIPTWHVYMGEGREAILIDYVHPNASQPQALSVNASLLDVSFNEKKYMIHFVFEPSPGMLNAHGQLVHNTTISFSAMKKFVFSAGDALMPFQVDFDYDEGDPIDYPFDRYTGYFERLGLRILTGRSSTTLGFSLFMCLLMWALSLILAVFGFQVAFRHRPVHAHGCMIGVTMLFALPTLRSAQPGVPENTGCIADVLGYYWNMAIIALQSITILGCWVARWSPQKEKEHKHLAKTDSQQTLHKFGHLEHIEHFAS